MISPKNKLKPGLDTLTAMAIIAIGVAFIVIPGWQLLDPGPFKWHIAQPAFWQGGTEALVLFGLLALAQLLPTRSGRLTFTLVLAELYLRRHAVDAAAIVDIVYFEICIGLGALVFRLSGNARPRSIADYVQSFVLGLCVWSVCAWSISAIGLGSLHDLRWMSLLVLVPAIMARSRPWCVFMSQRVDAMPKVARVCAGILFGWFLVQFARSAVAIDFDGLWYGLRGQYVLVGSGSAFASSGLVSPVFYFPKLYELFLIPLSGLGSSTVICGVTLLIGTMLAATSYEILKRLGLKQQAMCFAGVVLCMTVPAIANQLLQSKGDILATLLLAFAWIKASEFVASRNRASLIWFFGLMLLATQARLSAIPFAGAMTIAVALACLLQRPNAMSPTRQETRLAWVGLGLILVTSAFVTARTLLLAGMPTIGPDPLFKLWQILGFHLKYPAGTLHWSYPKDWSDIFPLLTDFLFRPERLGHIEISWVGNVWVWLAVVAGLAFLVLRRRSSLPASMSRIGFGLIAATIMLMLFWGYQIRGGDGNYFIAGLLPAVLLGVAAAWSSVTATTKARIALVTCIGAFSLFQAAYSFMSAAWTPGTRPFDLSFRRGVQEFRSRQHAMLNYSGLSRIGEYLRHQHGTIHVVGYVDKEPGFVLPATFEGLADISYSRPELVGDHALFMKFVISTKVKYLIMPHPGHHPTSDGTRYISPMIAKLTQDLATNREIRKIRDTDYDMYDLSGWVAH